MKLISRYVQITSIVTITSAGMLAAPPAQRAVPARVYAPYFETYLPGSPAAVARQAGVRFVTLAFATAAASRGPGACRLVWGGPSHPIGRYVSSARALRARGGGVIISFGGWTADQGGTEIAESCHSVRKIAAAYEQVVTSYRADWLSMDLEGPHTLTNWSSINRRDEAIALAERWAKANRIPLRIQLTLQVNPSGLNNYTLGVLRNAARDHATISSISLMAYDYYLYHETSLLPMGALAIKAADNVHRQLQAIYPRLTGAQVWRMLGFIVMNGIDDNPRGFEVTSLGSALRIMNFALARHMSYLSIWALHRDNGVCPGVAGRDDCSGISQARWAFSHLLGRFTSKPVSSGTFSALGGHR